MTAISRRECLEKNAALLMAWGAGTSLVARASDTESPDPDAVRKFAAKLGASGAVITPKSSDYDSARALFNRAFDRSPALIVRCFTSDAIKRSLEFAQAQSLPLSIRG